MDLENWRYPYGLKTYRLVLGLLLFSVAGYGGFHQALFGEKGLRLFGFIHLDVLQARVFWAALGILSIGLVVSAIISLYLGMTTERAVVLRPRAMTLPRHILTATEVTIPYRDILWLKMGGAGRHQYFRIRTDKENIMVRKGALPDHDTFMELYQELGTRVRRAEAAFGGAGYQS
ncbi:hypothetical protein [Dongia sp.]|uniref:hypothetical protein n=1 Tax=Dongia sp. TaxID=1977262 RepID=UPI0035AFAEE5